MYVTNFSGLIGGGSITCFQRSDSGVGCKLGTLSNDDDDGGGSENITKKMNLHPFKLYRISLEPPNSSNK